MASCFRLFLLVCAATTVLLGYLLYTPLPESMEDQPGAMVFLAIWKVVVTCPQKVRELLGQGDIRDNLSSEQIPSYREGDRDPLTSIWHSELNTTRATIEGVPVIVHRPWGAEGDDLRPGFIYFHGGGWVVATADIYDFTVVEFALCTGTVAINVDYRLAPQHTFPAAFDDAVAVTRYILRHGQKFGIDVNRVGVAGDSAGGNLAATTALHLKNFPEGEPPLIYQALLYPVVQALDFRLPSYIDYRDTINILHTDKMASFAAVYLGLGERNGVLYSDIFMENRHVSPTFRTQSKYAKYVDVKNLPEEYRTPKRSIPAVTKPYNETLFQQIKDLIVDPRFAPLMADDLSGLPPALVVATKHDVLRDDGFLYAKRLKDSGVKVILHHGKGFHIDHLRGFPIPETLRSKTGLKVVKNVCDFVTGAVKTS